MAQARAAIRTTPESKQWRRHARCCATPGPAAAAAPATSPSPSTSLLATTIVLVAPKSPENVGAAARAAANYGAAALAVAGPRFEWEDAAGVAGLPSPLYLPAARRVARGTAESAGGGLLARALVAPDLASLLPQLGPGWAVAVTRRAGTARAGPRSWARPAHLAAALVAASAPPPPLTLVFGREESGLTDAEVALCGGGCLALPTPPDAAHASLNLGAAVAVALALLHEAEAEGGGGGGGGRGQGTSAAAAIASPLLPALAPDPATPADIAAVVDRVSRLAGRLGLAPGENSGAAHGRKKRSAGVARAVLTRAGASRSEVAAVHLFLRAAEAELE
jgi:tRNA C32,U32 (ribose-2'-O)-methylase TrmJ